MFNKLFDRWSMVHFSFWLGTSAGLTLFLTPLWVWLTAIVGIFLWEALEYQLEKRELIDSKESWLNRGFSDPLISLLAAAMGIALVN